MRRGGQVASTNEVMFNSAFARASISVNQIAIVALEIKKNAVSACLVARFIALLKIIPIVTVALTIVHRKMSVLIAHETCLLVIHHYHRYASVKNTTLIVQQKSDPAVTYEGGSVELECTLFTLRTI